MRCGPYPPGPGRTRPISRTPPLVNTIRLDQIDHGNTPVWPVSGTPNLISSSRDWDPHVVLHSRGAGPHRRGDVLLVKSGPVGTPWTQLTTQKRPGAISRPYHTCVVFGVYAVPTMYTHRSHHAGAQNLRLGALAPNSAYFRGVFGSK